MAFWSLNRKKKLSQWFLKITDFTKELFDDLKKLKEWPEKVKTMQRNWIGISHGAEIIFEIQNSSKKIKVFTTRPETIFGASFLALSVEHDFSNDFENNKTFLKFKKSAYDFSFKELKTMKSCVFLRD